MALGPFNITVDGQLMLPEQPTTQTASHQNITVDWVNNFIYVSQVIRNNLLLSDEIAPALTQAQRGLAGDIAITQMDMTGAVVGVMYLRGVGHGTSLTAEPVGADTYLWTEADAVPDGSLSYGSKVGRVKFVADGIVDSSDPEMEKFNPVPGFRRVNNSPDFVNDRIAVIKSDMTSQRNRTYTVYNLTAFKMGVFAPIYEWPIVGLAADNSLQNFVLYGDFVYQLTGGAYSVSNPPPGNSFISCTDITTGQLLELVFNDTATELNNREPEGISIDRRGPEDALMFSFSTNSPAPIRFTTIYYWSLYLPVPPPGPDIPKWLYTTNTIEEAPFAWNSLMQRYRLARGVSTVEVSDGVYEETRFDAYTDELDVLAAGRNYFRGGYEHRVGDIAKANLINSGVATEANFVPL